MLKYLVDWLVILRKKQETYRRQTQDIQLKINEIEQNTDKYMFNRFAADLKYFELREVQINNREDKSAISRLIIAGRLVADSVRSRFIG